MVKAYYTISEIADLYHICPDSLRYYEQKGILTPRRDENGYRIYGVQDFWRLNVIKDLRQLNFSTERIKAYLDERTVETTLTLLAEEEALIGQEMEALSAQLANIRKRSADIYKLAAVPLGEIRLLHLPKRSCCRIQEHVSLDGEVDFLLTKLKKSHESTLYIIGNNRFGALLDEQAWQAGIYNQYSAVFIIDDGAKGEEALAAGEYLSVYYRGAYSQSAHYLPQLEQYAQDRGWTITGAPMEIYHIDIHETSQREEFLTEIQLPISLQEVR